MSETRCEEVLMQWMAELDGEPPALSGAQISSHLNACANCRRELEQMQQVDSLLQSQSRRLHDENLWPAVQEQLGARTVPQIGWTPFGLLGAVFVAYKLFEMLPERAPGIAFKLVPLVFVIGLFVLIKENPFRINPELTLER